MYATTVLVNSHDSSCPKCGAAIASGTKTCGSCGSVCLPGEEDMSPRTSLTYFSLAQTCPV